jgi:hypothetical protein
MEIEWGQYAVVVGSHLLQWSFEVLNTKVLYMHT